MSDDRWQLESIYGGLDAADYRAARRALDDGIARLEATADAVGLGGGAPVAVDDAAVDAFERVLEGLNELLALHRTLEAYLAGFTTADAFDDAAQSEASSLRSPRSRLQTLQARLTAFLGRVDPEALVGASALAADHRHFVVRAARRARHQMGDEAEALAAALDASSGAAWERLYDDLISRGTVSVRLPGRDGEEELGVPALVNLQSDADRRVREAAFRAEVALLERHEIAYAAAMNGIKGQVGTLTRRRSWSDALEAAVVEQGIDGTTLAAMQEAVEGAFPDVRRYLRAKASLLGLERLSWYDRRAPAGRTPAGRATAGRATGPGAERSGTGRPRFSWPDGHAFVVDRLDRFAPRFGDLARRARSERWIDVHPRRGKTTGAFCMTLPIPRESRVLLNWGGAVEDVLTLAHELGHAYHNDCAFRSGRTPIQAETPMTLAETASMFAETIVLEATLDGATSGERLGLLEASLVTATAITVDIHSRFLFERGVFERRAERDLSVPELDALMLDAQAATYGDGLAEDGRFAKAWAEKPHYYSSGLSFYNFPYTFGYLFGLGLFARHREDPDGFAGRFEAFLASTGTDDVASLARGMGCDVTDPGFWDGALGVVRARVDEYVRAAEVPA